jgi:antitoxin ParD1/3/4
MPTANVNLSSQQASFIKRAIDDGRFRNASEVVRAGLHLLSKQAEYDQLRLKYLRKMAKQGFDDIDAGRFEWLDSGDLSAFMRSVSASAPKKAKTARSRR